MKKMEKAYEGMFEELAMETIEEKEEILSLEKFGKYAYTKTAKSWRKYKLRKHLAKLNR